MLITLLFLGQFVITYFTNFFIQKGKNLADKEDIEKLTEIVEEVKSKFNNENERLKATLSIIVDKESKSYTQEQQSIIAFYTEINAWIWDKTKISIHEYGYKDVDKLNQKIIDMDQCSNQVNINNAVMDLLVKDKDLTQNAYYLIIETLKLHQFVESKCKTLKKALQGLNAYMPMIDKYDTMSDLMKNHVSKQVKELEASKDEAIKDFYNQRGEIFNILMPKLHEFKNLAKVYLSN
ncbi:MAG: hypothetical protein ABI367_13510 [Mucilaginibacter sp.]